MMKILMIGPLPPPIGGVSVLFSVMVDLLRQRDDVAIEVVDFSGIRNQKGQSFSFLFSLIKSIIIKVRRQQVVILFCSDFAIATFGLLLLLICRIANKPLIIKKAGCPDYYALGPLLGRLAHFVIKHAALFLAETKFFVQLVQGRGISHARWFPNIRALPGGDLPMSAENRRCRRFVFAGQVREHKGVREIINAAERFDEDITVDIFGPLFDDLGPNIFKACRRAHFGGVLSPEKVIPTLAKYDMMLLPTKHQEGYPGAVIEAYLAGIPMITTRYGGIPEIVDEKTGVFIQAGNADALYEAMKRVVENPIFYQQLVQGVAVRRREFSSTIWVDRFVEYCRHVVTKNECGLPNLSEN